MDYLLRTAADVPAMTVDRFLAYATQHERVWFGGRADIANWWLEHQPA